MKIIAIAAMAKNRIIWNQWKIPWHSPEDFKHFKEVTMGAPIIMGRITYESIGRPLPGRRNIVVSREDFNSEWVEIYNDITRLLSALESQWVEKVYICWGSQIYTYCFENSYIDEVVLSIMDGNFEWDAYFPIFENEFISTTVSQREWFSIHTFSKHL